MTLTDLKKRLVPGQKIVMLENDFATKERLAAHIGLVREISHVQSNGIYIATKEQMKIGSKGNFLNFPKASELEFHDQDTFTIHVTEELKMKYQLL